MGDGEDPAKKAKPSSKERPQPSLSAVLARVETVERRLAAAAQDLEQAQIVIKAQQLTLKELMEDKGGSVDSRSTMLLGAMWNLAQDPFNSGAWDKFRQFLKAAQRA